MSVELQGALSTIWRLGEESTVPTGSNLALLESGQECYLMFADSSWGRGYSDEDLLPPEIEDAPAELIASYEVFQEAVPEFTPSPNGAPWDTYRAARPEHWAPANPSMYRITGVGFDELKRRLLKDAYTSLTTVRLDENANVLEGQQTYEARNINSRRDFFGERGISEGDYYCSSVNDDAITVLCAIDAQKGEADAISADASYSNRTWLSNELVYRVELDACVFKIYLKAEAASAEHEFLAIRNLLNFFFGAVHQPHKREQSFIEFFSNYLNVEPQLLSRWFEAEEWAELFLGPLDHCNSGYREDWIRPDYISIQIQTSNLDTSYGTVVNGPVVTYMESFENWCKSDFERVAAEPYLARLRGQAGQQSMRPRL